MTGSDIAREGVIDLLGRCTVELWHPAGRARGSGSGFFIAPGVILTCSHVVAACTDQPMVRAGRTEVRASASVRSQSPAADGSDTGYTGFPDMALVYVSVTDHPCAWLDRRIPSRGTELTVVTRHQPKATAAAPEPRPILIRYQQETTTDSRSKLWIAAGAPGLTTERSALRITKGTSGSPVLDDRTLRVVGMVNASNPGGDEVHVIPVVSGLAAFAGRLHALDPAPESASAAAAPPAPNPVLQTWYGHDRHHGADGTWPAIVQDFADADQPAGNPASVQLLPPRLEQRLLALLAELGDPRITDGPERVYRDCVADPGGPITPGPIHTLRDAVWHAATRRTSEPVLRTLVQRVARRHASAAVAPDLLAWVKDFERLHGLDSTPVTPAGSEVRREPAAHAHPWPSAVMVRLTPSYRRADAYRCSVWSRDAHGNWSAASAGEREAPRVAAALDLVKEDVRLALGHLVRDSTDSARHAGPVLEFSVPPELFDHPFDEWELFAGRPVSELHPVVVRDDDVLEVPGIQAYADLAWARVRQTGGHPPVGVRCQELPDDGLVDVFRDRFTGSADGEPDDSGRLVILPGPVTPPARAASAMRVLRTLWTPMVLWSRDACPHPHPAGSADPVDPPCGGADFLAAVGLRVDGVAVAKLPAEVKALREQARRTQRLIDAGRAGPERVTVHNPMLAAAVLLWDPPNRLPLNHHLAAPGAAV